MPGSSRRLPTQPPEQPLLRAAVALGRALREEGLRAGVGEELLFCGALAEVDVTRRTDVYWAARAAFVRAREELGPFESVFARYWEGLDLAVPPPVAEHGEGDPRMAAAQHGGESLPPFRREGRIGAFGDGARARGRIEAELAHAAVGEHGRGEQRGVLAAYSPDETLSGPERLELDRSEVATVRRLAEELRRSVPERRSRRLRPTRGRARLDVRATLRRSLATEGEPFRPAYAARSSRPRRLLLLCDVSGSMERCSRAMLAVLGAAVAANVKAEAFVLATRLTRLTRPLAGRDLERALERAREAVSDWSGGTRIGQTLAEFNRTFGRLGLARGAIVVVVSDGWDRGEPELLAWELARLRLQVPAARVGQPAARGARRPAARRRNARGAPHVDDFIAEHDPQAATRLAELVRGLTARPGRRQRAAGVANTVHASSSVAARAR